jgi:UDP-N-acetylglucosamine 2-epimerase
VLAARRLGIPVVVVVDLFAIAESGWLRDAAYGDAVCVLAPSVRQRLIDLGRPAQQVHVTGNPAFDRLADPELPTRARDLRRSRGWHDARVITWASQPEPSDPQLPRRIEQALIAGLEQHPAWHLVLRPHPSDAYALPTPGPRLTISTRADDLHTLLHASEAVVTMTSTVGLEAVLCGKPLITWDRSENTAGAPYAALGLSTGVADLDQLVPTIAAAVAAPRPVSGLPMVGQATALVANQIRRLIGLPALAAQVR